MSVMRADKSVTHCYEFVVRAFMGMRMNVLDDMHFIPEAHQMGAIFLCIDGKRP